MFDSIGIDVFFIVICFFLIGFAFGWKIGESWGEMKWNEK